jgi:hypothetical protein
LITRSMRHNNRPQWCFLLNGISFKWKGRKNQKYFNRLIKRQICIICKRFLTIPVNSYIGVIKNGFGFETRYVGYCVFVNFKICFTEKNVKLLGEFSQILNLLHYSIAWMAIRLYLNFEFCGDCLCKLPLQNIGGWTR